MTDKRFVRGRFLHVWGGPPSLIFTFELAVTPTQLGAGLKGRATLPERHGMLFTFPYAGRHSFWMQDTAIPLDIAWLSPTGVIQEIGDLLPYDETEKKPQKDARYAIELNATSLLRHSIKVGDRLVLLPGALA